MQLTEYRVPIISGIPDYYHLPDRDGGLDYEAICFFAATGFFCDDATYFRNQKAFRPGYEYAFDAEGRVARAEPYFSWHYAPRDISFKQATEEFAHLFERIAREEVAGERVLLPLSGGLDSRSQAAALRDRPEAVYAYAYEYEGGARETSYGRQISAACGYPFRAFTIPPGYLWDKIESMADTNRCYAEFTGARQAAILEELYDAGTKFSLGHGGDLFFDNSGVEADLSRDDQLAKLRRKIVRRGGDLLGQSLWRAWGLSGRFEDYLQDRLGEMLDHIEIDDANARLRAFKSRYYVPRWTNVSLAYFGQVHPLSIPYFHDDMCAFICGVPEAHLADRQIQIAYMQEKTPELARIPWQKYDPYDLNSYHRFPTAANLPRRAWRKVKRETARRLLGRRLVQRNWEIQLYGAENQTKLRRYLFEQPAFRELLPNELAADFYRRFREAPLQYAHPVSMLLTLSLFSKKFWRQP